MASRISSARPSGNFPDLVYDGVEGLAANKLSCQVGDRLAGYQDVVCEVAVIDEAHDPGMIEGRDSVGLTAESRLRNQVFRDLIPQDLEGDELLGLEVFRLPNPAGSADPDQTFEPEAVGDREPSHQRHGEASFRPDE